MIVKERILVLKSLKYAAISNQILIYIEHGFLKRQQASITRACNNLVRPDELASFAVDVGQELDLRIGAAFTRMQTFRLTKLFPEVISQQLISYGSCQFPVLGFVVERYKEIVAFVAETFFKIKAQHSNHDGEAEFIWARV